MTRPMAMTRVALGLSMAIAASSPSSAQTVNLQSTSPGTQQTGHFNVSGVGIAQLQDLGGQVYNVRNKYPAVSGCSSTAGAAGDGTTDDTSAIDCAIKAAAARTPTRGVVFFPPGTYKTSGNYNLTGYDGLAIVGSGVRSTTIRLAHATNDLFYWTAGNAQDQVFRDFLVNSDTVTRTGGWVFHVNAAYNSGQQYLVEARFTDIDFRNQYNGAWIAQFVSVYMTNVVMTQFVGGSGTGLKIGQTTSSAINQGSGMILRDVQIYGNNFATNQATPLGTGVVIEDCDAVVAYDLSVGGCNDNCLVMIANTLGYGLSNHFFAQSFFDATKSGHSVWVKGGGAIDRLRFTGCWFASAGRLPSGSSGLNCFRADTGIGHTAITGSNFFNSTGDLVDIRAGGTLTFTGNTLSAPEHQNAMLIDCGAVDSVGPVITGNLIFGGGGTLPTGYAIKTASTCNRIVVVGNTLGNGTSWGIAPNVLANNGS